MNRTTYTFALRMFKPLLLAWLSRRASRSGGQWEIRGDTRFGRYTQIAPADSLSTDKYSFSKQLFCRPIWVHAVSLGETRAAQPLIRALLDEGYPVLLTNTTLTGRRLAQSLFSDALLSGQLVLTWLPYDFPHAVQGFLEHWRPRCGLLIEREVWPNLIAQAQAQHIPMILVSARFSESALKTNKLLGMVMREAYQGLEFVLSQTTEDSERLQTLGVQNIEVVGNLKFDLQISQSQVHYAEVVRSLLRRPVIALASVREGEEVLFIQEIARRLKSAQKPLPLFLLIPRHVESYEISRQYMESLGIHYVVRSEHPENQSLREADVMLCDTMGEMYFYYGLSDVAIIGGSFLAFGGQNHIEPCALGVPVIFGPHTENFAQAAEDAVFAGAARRVENVSEAIQLALDIINDDLLRQSMGQSGRQWLSLHEGATRRIMQAITPYLK